jgi:hypothetical protein
VIKARSSSIESQTPATDITLRFPLFEDAAVSAALSRRYGGIHILSGDTFSRQLGKAVGNQAATKADAYIKGKAAPQG